MHLPRPPPSKTQHDTLFSSLFESCISGGGGGIVLFSSGSYLPSVCACAPQVCATDTYVTKERAAVEREREKKSHRRLESFSSPKKLGGRPFWVFFPWANKQPKKSMGVQQGRERERRSFIFVFSCCRCQIR